MPIIKPISDLQSYNTVLSDVSPDSPVFLTINGRGRYVLMDIDEYEKNMANIALLSALTEGEISAKMQECLSVDEAKSQLGLK